MGWGDDSMKICNNYLAPPGPNGVFKTASMSP